MSINLLLMSVFKMRVLYTTPSFVQAMLKHLFTFVRPAEKTETRLASGISGDGTNVTTGSWHHL
ncbi:MAG: hypothetical protein JST01_29430 [Cyanobacteria bacterium SZAS TMP-1]|nr:hypothetical protein [Cyanobacteria bacterium SZAS TMP-1]